MAKTKKSTVTKKKRQNVVVKKETKEIINKEPKNVKKDIKETIKKVFKNIALYFKNNKMFLIFILLNVFNGWLLRCLTLKDLNNALYISPFLADLGFCILIGSFSYLFKNKGKYRYLLTWTIIMTLLCIINSCYYTFYTSFTSISLLSTLKFITQVGDAVVENVLQIKDLAYIASPILFIYLNHHYTKSGYYEKVKYLERKTKHFLFTVLGGIIAILLFSCTLTATDIGRLTKQWNREYVVSKFGIYVYHVNDLIKSMEPRIASLFGYDNALKEFNEYYCLNVNPNNSEETCTKREIITNEYTNMYEGYNIITIHAESIMNFLIGLEFNGVEVTPNLNKLAKEGLYFNNFYSQVSVGTSSDTEFTLNTSLMPANLGTAFGNYFENEYVSIPKLLKEKGYYSFAMHGNNGDYWNRRIMHKNLGYDDLYAKDTYIIDEEIGLGLSDASFFRQSVQKLIKIKEEHNKYYGTLIMLSNHTPFADTDKYGEFDVSIKENVLNEETGEYEEVIHPYLEGTKLGNYIKSVHYADYALGILMDELEQNNLLDNTVIIIYGDHDSRLSTSNYVKMYNYNIETDALYEETDERYVEFNEYDYELNRKVPFIIWSKDKKQKAQTISYPMGMYDVMPTLGNMFGFYNEYQLGHDIFNIKEDNIVVFPSGNYLTNKLYYNSQNGDIYILNNSIISQDYINKNQEYTDKLLEVSNNILVYDLIKNSKTELVNENEMAK